MIYDVHVFLLKQRQQYSKRNNTRDKRSSAFSSVSDDGDGRIDSRRSGDQGNNYLKMENKNVEIIMRIIKKIK